MEAFEVCLIGRKKEKNKETAKKKKISKDIFLKEEEEDNKISDSVGVIFWSLAPDDSWSWKQIPSRL